MMKNILKKLIVKKNEGQSELLCSIFVIMAFIVVLFISVGMVRDISKITYVDQVARQGIIKLEIQGGLNASEIANIKQTLSDAGLKFDNTHTLDVNGVSVPDGVYVTYRNGSNKWLVDKDNTHKFKYGEEIGIYIQCQVQVFNFNGNIFGGTQVEKFSTVTRLKASITKRTS